MKERIKIGYDSCDIIITCLSWEIEYKIYWISYKTAEQIHKQICSHYDFSESQKKRILTKIYKWLDRLKKQKDNEEKNKQKEFERKTQATKNKYKAFIDEYIELCYKHGYYFNSWHGLSYADDLWEYLLEGNYYGEDASVA